MKRNKIEISVNYTNLHHMSYLFENKNLLVKQSPTDGFILGMSKAARSSHHLDFDSFLSSIDINAHQISFSSKIPKLEVFKFIAENISKFVELALTDSTSLEGLKAYKVLTNSPLFLDALTKDTTFFLKVTEVLSSFSTISQPDIIIISRIAVILTYLILRDEQVAIDSIGFLIQLFPYIENSAVFSLFHTIFTDQDLKNMRQVLAIIDIDVFLINELKRTPEENSLYTNDVYSKNYNLLSILNDGLSNSVLKLKLQNGRILNQLLSLLPDANDIILRNQIWLAFSRLAKQKILHKMKTIFNQAYDIITQPFDELHSYHTYIFDFLSVVVDLNASMFSGHQKKQICEICKTIFTKFENSTNLLSSMFTFIRKSLHNRDFAQIILDNYINFFIDEGRKEKRTAAAANALDILADLEAMRTSSYMISKSLTNNAKYMRFYQSFFKKYLEELQEPYGGNVVRYVSDMRSSDKNKQKTRK